VAQVLAAGLRVESIPGACALVVGLTASGLPTESFHFAGFLPHKSGQRARRLGELGAIPGTLVLYESPFRVERLLSELQLILPGRPVVLARELTKKFEEWLRGTPAELAAEWARRPRKGEFVVMIGPTGHTGSPTAGRVTSDAMDDTADETEPRSEESVDSPTD
jgi:16S rRNA (cytidine1402-2'-O)-methyltransferase